jgi:hypothetical protein
MKNLLALATILVPGAALAHEGHGTLSDPVLHLLGEPVHALPLLAVIVGAVALFVARRADKVKTRR